MILADATRAEVYKLACNRTALFWAFGLVPAFTLLSGLAIETWSRASGLRIAPANALGGALDGLASAGNPLVQLLLIVGASVVFAGEYRWQTWRAILPRSERLALLTAKFAAYALFAAASLGLTGLAGWLVQTYAAVVLGVEPATAIPLAQAMQASAVAFGASVLQVLVIAGLVAVVSVISRSVLAATAGPFIFLVGLELLASRQSIVDADPVFAALPNMAARGLREYAAGLAGDPDAVGLQLASPGALALLVWILVLAAIALAAFRRQDLSEE